MSAFSKPHLSRTLFAPFTVIILGACSSAPNMAPGTPQGFKVTPGDAQVALVWKANTESDLKGYIVSYGLASGALTNTLEVAAPTVAANVTGLVNGTNYLFAVAAQDSAGNISRKTTALQRKPVAPPPPSPPVP
jgi:Fibronectin type III domain